MRHFDLVVIGSGTGNTIITKQFADWRVALIDGQKWFGGTCLNVGCIPTGASSASLAFAAFARHCAGSPS